MISLIISKVKNKYIFLGSCFFVIFQSINPIFRSFLIVLREHRVCTVEFQMNTLDLEIVSLLNPSPHP